MKKNLLLIFISLIFSFLLMEGVLRFLDFSYPIFYCYDKYAGVKLRPNVEGWWRSEGKSYIRINSAGMRDDREINKEKPPGIYRIAVLGDSYAEALQVDVSLAFWRILEKKINECGFSRDKRVEVINFGCSAYSTAQELIMLRQYAGSYNPDMVILAFLSGNDVRDNSKEIVGSDRRPYFHLLNGGKLVTDENFREFWTYKIRSGFFWIFFEKASDYSRTIQFFYKIMSIFGQKLIAPSGKNEIEKIGLDDHIYLSYPPPEWERAWKTTEALISEINAESQKMGARFLLVTLTNPIQVLPDSNAVKAHASKLKEADLFYPEQRLKIYADKNNIEGVFLAEPFADYSSKQNVYLHGFPDIKEGFGHWNKEGHALAADQIAKYLCK